MISSGKRNQVTLREVADRAKVSIGTASRLINNYSNVESDLRLRVLTAVNELGYDRIRKKRVSANNKVQTENGVANPNLYVTDNHTLTEASNLNSRSQHRVVSQIAFCCCSVISTLMHEVYNPYFSAMLYGVEHECRMQNLHLVYQVIEDSKTGIEESKRKLLEAGVEGLLLVNFVNQELVKDLLSLNLSTVLVDHYFPQLPQLDTVTHENYKGAAQAVTHLIKRGHRGIGFINGLPHYTVQSRFEAYRATLERNQIPFEPTYVLDGDLNMGGGLVAAQEIMKRNLDCTAYFCANDQIAIGLIQGLRSYGIQVPQDISVVGFDDIETARLITPALTTVRANPVWIGRLAVRKLLERCQRPDSPVTETALSTFIIERDSVRDIHPENQ